MQSGLLNPKEDNGAPRRVGKALGQSIHPGSESGKGVLLTTEVMPSCLSRCTPHMNLHQHTPCRKTEEVLPISSGVLLTLAYEHSFLRHLAVSR